jgi:hypothetical protein
MRVRLLFASFLSFAVISGFAACKGAKEPVTPPTDTGPSAAPRTDGVYASKVQAGSKPGWDLLRFFPDKRVVSVSTTGSIESAAALLYDTGDAGVATTATGRYEVKEGVLRFTMDSKVGSVEYAGAAQGDKLALRWHSLINDVTLEEAFSFVAVTDDAPDAEDGGASDSGGSAEEPASDGATAPALEADAVAGPTAKPDAGRPKRRQKR